MLHSCLRWLLRICACIDLRVTRFLLRLRGEPTYTLRGECHSCGACCETPMIRTFPLISRFAPLRRLFLWRHRLDGLELIDEIRDEDTFVFRCLHWDPQTHQCRDYRNRPCMCRDYPRPLLFSPSPTFLPGCGYYARAENAEKIRESLRELDLPPETIRELEEKMHARD